MLDGARTVITLPWPPKGLQPHAKGHWWAKARATKAYREQAFWLAKAAGVTADPNARLVFAYHPPNRARRDCQNMPGMLKAAVDGIAQAMGCDDHGFRCAFPEVFADPVKGGAVVVEVQR
jgi:crossover junction endodeoxyribonuclease RusA